ncbi:MAG TPA: arylsulfotransferase family protein [Gaiellaceae bacterium]|nr:arylsulfotransferase family protein [Gaiellaceae bacterium]
MNAPAALALGAICCLAAAGASGAAAPATTRSLRTLPGVDVPIPLVTHAAAGTAPGFVFVAEKGPGQTGGPMIVDNDGRVIWYHQLAPPIQATDFRVQRYRGQPVLTFWEGTSSRVGVGRGSYLVYDTSYRQVAHVRAGHGLQGDLHEFQLTPRGTAYVTVYHEVPADLSTVGGPKHGYVYDSIVQELDVATGRVVFEWHSIGHVPFAESTQANRPPARHASKKQPLDYFHVNSIADGPGGTILVSARNTSTIYLLARDGRILWRLGGSHSDFGPPAAVKFAFQHNARLHPGDLLTLFDNGGIPRVEPYSRPLVLRLDRAKKRATIVRTFAPPKRIASPFEGNLQLLPDGGALVGWGGVRIVSEFAPDGRLRFQLKLPYGDTYRAYRSVWAGRPAAKPIAAVDGGTVYASWNGATGIARWEALAGPDAAHLQVVGTAPWRDLETAIPAAGAAGIVAVRALDAHGRVLGTSRPVKA